MNYNKKEVNYLVYLLSCAIKCEEPKRVEGIDYDALLDLANKHQVYNIIISAIKDNPDVSDKQKQNFKNYNLSEISRMIVVGNERNNIYSFLEENKIKYMPLKGLVIRDYYPNQSMRQMSDNDILFDVSYRDEISNFMKKNGYKCVATGENTDDYHKEPYCTFEFHKTLFFKEQDFCPVFDNLWEKAVRDEEHSFMYHMDVSDVYIYSVCHMYKHFSTAGCGIRFLADNYLILNKEEKNLDWDYINSFLSSCGILDFERKTRQLAFKLFDGGELDNDELSLFETIMNFGIFGNGTVRLRNKIESMNTSSVEEAKKKIIKDRLFPPKKKMVADYRILEKKPYLLGAVYVYRLFKALFNSKKTINELNTIKSIDAEKEN